jgi:hypothetical protein
MPIAGIHAALAISFQLSRLLHALAANFAVRVELTRRELCRNQEPAGQEKRRDSNPIHQSILPRSGRACALHISSHSHHTHPVAARANRGDEQLVDWVSSFRGHTIDQANVAAGAAVPMGHDGATSVANDLPDRIA